MASINPYLSFPGNAEEAFNFYREAFGGEFIVVQRMRDLPGNEKVPAELLDKILHISLPIGKDDVLMASDIIEGMGPPHSAGNNVTISINVDSEDEAGKLFNALSAGGKVTLPLAKVFWGSFFGQFTDKFGIHWMMSYDYDKK